MKYFFSFIDAIPPQLATPAFSVRHLGVLCFFIVAYTGLTARFKDKRRTVRSKYVLTLAWLLFFLDISNELWLAVVGHFTVRSELPLQLCGMMCILLPLMVMSRNTVLMEFVYACGMPGALLAMLTPNIQGYYFLSWGYLMFIAIHSLIVYIPLFLLMTGEMRPRIHRLPKVAGLFFSLVLLDFVVDKQLGSNYLYLRWAPDGTLLKTFDSWAGTPGYIWVALCVVVMVWIALYLPWELRYRTERRQILGAE